MSGPFWGTDKRVLPGVTAWLQNLATFRSDVGPPTITVEFLGLRIYLPFHGKYWCFRVHVWRYDPYAKAYIFFSSMFKAVNVTDPRP